MVFLLYLWETLKNWTLSEEMRRGYDPAKKNSCKTVHLPSQEDDNCRRADQPIKSYPEGGWGWIVCACTFLAHLTTSGCQFSGGALQTVLAARINGAEDGGRWLGPFSVSVSYVSAPFVVNMCQYRRARLVSAVGGCLFPLSLFLTSFVTELHHVFLTFGVLGGIASTLVRESSNVLLSSYFRRRRQFVEQVVMAGTGVGVTLFSLLFLSLGRHVAWQNGFQLGAAPSLITAILPLFYRPVKQSPPKQTHSIRPKARKRQNPYFPIGGDVYHSLRLFCVPQIKPLLWATGIGSAGLFLPLFVLLEVSREEGLTGGSSLLLQTHLGLGLSLGVILGAIFTIKRQASWDFGPRTRAAITALLSGASIVIISTLNGYYAYSLAAWGYGIAFGSHLYTIKIAAMELTRTKHWEKIWALMQAIMAAPIITSILIFIILKKDAFYVAAASLIVCSAILGIRLPSSHCNSPEPSEDNESPIPPPPPRPPFQWPTMHHGDATITRSISLNQPPVMPSFYKGPFYTETFTHPGINFNRSQSLPQAPTYKEAEKHRTHSNSSFEPSPNARPRRDSARFPDLPIEPQFFPVLQIPLQQQEPAFTRYYFDSSLFQYERENVSGQDFCIEKPQFNSLRRPPRTRQGHHLERRASFHNHQYPRPQTSLARF